MMYHNNRASKIVYVAIKTYTTPPPFQKPCIRPTRHHTAAHTYPRFFIEYLKWNHHSNDFFLFNVPSRHFPMQNTVNLWPMSIEFLVFILKTRRYPSKEKYFHAENSPTIYRILILRSDKPIYQGFFAPWTTYRWAQKIWFRARVFTL